MSNATTLSLVLCAAAMAATVDQGNSPFATIDLTTDKGVKAVNGEWRYSDTRIVGTAFRAAGPEGQPTGAAVNAYDFEPHAGGAAFDDSGWEKIAPETLDRRRTNGRLAFNWYRIGITVPERVDGMETKGSLVTFETSLDDYAEIWVDGELARAPGQSGGSVIAGWNVPNRLVIGRNVKPGQRIQLAVFGINGPVSNPPTNFVFMRSARLGFHRGAEGPVAVTPAEVNVEVIRNDPRMDEIVGPNPKVFKLAEGFEFTEGPVWVRDGGYLLFSDPNANTIYKFVPGAGRGPGELSIFRKPSGYSGNDIAAYGQPGSNGLAVSPGGGITINQHGNRRVIRLEKDGRETVLADRYQGKRLNSPNDLVYRSDGTLFFTDPPFGLPKFHADPRKELSYSGVFSLRGGTLRLVTNDFSGPNGIALSPDERYLYVANWDEKNKAVMRYQLNADGTVRDDGELLYDMTSAKGEDALDGMKVDAKGNLYVSGPGGIWVLSDDGTHLGTIVTPRHAHNFAWGDDGSTLYIAARNVLYRMRLSVGGSRW
jgi:gluconolactonase